MLAVLHNTRVCVCGCVLLCSQNWDTFAAQSQDQGAPSPELLPLNVVFVDDSLANHHVFSQTCDALNWTLKSFHSGVELITAHRRCELDGIDIIFIELHMPEIDGCATARMLDNIGCDIPVFLLAAFTGTVANIVVPGVTAVISKPVQVHKVIEGVVRADKRERN